MADKVNLRHNFIFQFLYQAMMLIIPLVVTPYLTRCMGSRALGTYTYVNSIASYFVVFANLGISRHGQRVIARSRGNGDALRKSFWSLYALHGVLSLAAAVTYGIFFGMIYAGENRNLYLICGFYVISALYDVTWLFYGLENVKSVVAKNGLIKAAECAAIFSLVHGPEDLWIYAAIVSAGVLLGQLVMIPQALALVKPIGICWADIKSHIKPLILFSAVVIAVTLYTVFDKTLLGLMSTKENVAYYEYANRIIGVPRSFTTVAGTILFPKACRLAAEGDIRGQRQYLTRSVEVVYFVGFAAMFGLAAVSDLLAQVYLGAEFRAAGGVIKAMCALPLIIGLGDVLRTQYLIPNQKDKAFFLCVAMNAVVNLILSWALIPALGIYGAVAGTCCAEGVGLICQLILCRKMVSIPRLLKQAVPFLVIGGIMYALVRLTAWGLWPLLLQIGIGGGVYCGLTAVYAKVRKNVAKGCGL